MTSPYSVKLIVAQLTVELERIGFKVQSVEFDAAMSRAWGGNEALNLVISAKDEWTDTITLVDKPAGGIFTNHCLFVKSSNDTEGSIANVIGMYAAVEFLLTRTGERLLKFLDSKKH